MKSKFAFTLAVISTSAEHFPPSDDFLAWLINSLRDIVTTLVEPNRDTWLLIMIFVQILLGTHLGFLQVRSQAR